MSRDLDVLLLLRNVLGLTSQGKGVSSALVSVFSGKKGGSEAVARLTLLGFPPLIALSALQESSSAEVTMLSDVIVGGAQASVSLMGAKGGTLSLTLEKWLKEREGILLEMKVIRFRALLISAILGAVAGMISALAPLVGSLGFASPGAGSEPNSVLALGAVTSAIGSMTLGWYVSTRTAIAAAVVALLLFMVVSSSVSPLATATAPLLWGIK